jgi:hypothetical protein
MLINTAVAEVSEAPWCIPPTNPLVSCENERVLLGTTEPSNNPSQSESRISPRSLRFSTILQALESMVVFCRQAYLARSLETTKRSGIQFRMGNCVVGM